MLNLPIIVTEDLGYAHPKIFLAGKSGDIHMYCVHKHEGYVITLHFASVFASSTGNHCRAIASIETTKTTLLLLLMPTEVSFCFNNCYKSSRRH